MNKPYVTAAILAAGTGSRMNEAQTKQKIKLLGKSIVRRAVELFDATDLVDDIIVVIRREEEDFIKAELVGIKKPYRLVVGGSFRAESAKNAFLALNPQADFIAIHDAARCITAVSDIENVIKDAITYGAATASREVFDTLKEINSDGSIKCTLDRDLMRFAETPQVFSREIYKKALDSIGEITPRITDDNMLMEAAGINVFCSKMHAENLKITTKSDISYAEFILKGKSSNE